MSFIDYIEESCKNIEDNHISYLFKKKLLNEMTNRANEMSHAGLKNEKVITDLLADEYPDIENQYKVFEKTEKKKARSKFLRTVFALGGVIYFIAIFAAYFFVSNATGDWARTWLIIVGGIFSMIIFYVSFLIKRLYLWHRFLHPLARVLLAGCVMLASVFAFLFVLMMFDPGISWIIVILGIMAMLISDLIFAFVTKQKFRTISLFAYMPILATMLYIVLAGSAVITWAAGWPIIFVGLAVDFIIALTIAASNAKYFMYKQEGDE